MYVMGSNISFGSRNVHIFMHLKQEQGNQDKPLPYETLEVHKQDKYSF